MAVAIDATARSGNAIGPKSVLSAFCFRFGFNPRLLAFSDLGNREFFPKAGGVAIRDQNAVAGIFGNHKLAVDVGAEINYNRRTAPQRQFYFLFP